MNARATLSNRGEPQKMAAKRCVHILLGHCVFFPLSLMLNITDYFSRALFLAFELFVEQTSVMSLNIVIEMRRDFPIESNFKYENCPMTFPLNYYSIIL
jgi:hypothetical protein